VTREDAKPLASWNMVRVGGTPDVRDLTRADVAVFSGRGLRDLCGQVGHSGRFLGPAAVIRLFARAHGHLPMEARPFPARGGLRLECVVRPGLPRSRGRGRADAPPPWTRVLGLEKSVAAHLGTVRIFIVTKDENAIAPPANPFGLVIPELVGPTRLDHGTFPEPEIGT